MLRRAISVSLGGLRGGRGKYDVVRVPGVPDLFILRGSRSVSRYNHQEGIAVPRPFHNESAWPGHDFFREILFILPCEANTT